MDINESPPKLGLSLKKAGLVGLPATGTLFLLWKILQGIIVLVKSFPLHVSLFAWAINGGLIITLAFLFIILWIRLWWLIRRSWRVTHSSV